MSDLDLKERLRHRSTMMRVDNPDAKLMDEAADRIAALEDALRPFARVADQCEREPSCASVIVNIDRCRDARTVLTQGDA